MLRRIIKSSKHTASESHWVIPLELRKPFLDATKETKTGTQRDKLFKELQRIVEKMHKDRGDRIKKGKGECLSDLMAARVKEFTRRAKTIVKVNF
jgi:hypothetical protein